MYFKAVKTELSGMGIEITVPQAGQYKIKPKGCRDESLVVYTNDLEKAYMYGRRMGEKGLAKSGERI